MGRIVNLGVLGCGFMGQVHLMNFLKCKNCNVIAVCDKKQKLGRIIAEKWHIPKFYQSHIDMAEDKEIDAVAVITNDHLHALLSIDIMKHGKHVFVEKPIATTLEDAKDMVRTAEKHGVKLMIAYMKRYDLGIRKAKEILEDTELGEITSVRIHDYAGDWICNFPGPIIKTDEPYPSFERRYPKWLPTQERKRFEAFNNVFCHDINLMRFLFKEPRKILFTNFEREIFNTTIFSYNNFTTTLETGFYEVKAKWDEYVIAYFEKGWLRIDLPPPLLINIPAKVTVCKAGKSEKTLQTDYSWSFMREAQHFIDCIINDREPLSPGRDALRDMEIVENIFKMFLRID